ncbi:STAS domain-containing protein [Kitasatospora sp. NBC_01246]|uniref:STAS domain-containing protein n=1 Tax=Kitasatospora sp. NBC_01246 TaxID=2903570 RepID=UPI002E317B3E|nr:STAS domain-containing protein [Kitasatospora sp. NBC_01246]
MSDTPGREIAAVVRETGTGPVIEVSGDLDIDQVDVLHAVFNQVLLRTPAPSVVLVDLWAVPFCDSSGLNELLRARLQAEQRGTLLALARPSRQVVRLLDVTGTDQVFEVTEGPPARSA